MYGVHRPHPTPARLRPGPTLWAQEPLSAKGSPGLEPPGRLRRECFPIVAQESSLFRGTCFDYEKTPCNVYVSVGTGRSRVRGAGGLAAVRGRYVSIFSVCVRAACVWIMSPPSHQGGETPTFATS